MLEHLLPLGFCTLWRLVLIDRNSVLAVLVFPKKYQKISLHFKKRSAGELLSDFFFNF